MAGGYKTLMAIIDRNQHTEPVAQTVVRVPEPAVDMVNHPPHYKKHPSGVECIEITRHMPFNIGNAIKYLWRSEHKNGKEDLEKAIFYIKDEIERLYGNKCN